MNIFYINHYAGSPAYGMEYRPYYLSKEWLKLGHNVQIVACSFSHVRTKNPQVNAPFFYETIDGINYTWIPANSYTTNGMLRLKNIVTFLLKIIIHYKNFIKNKPDVVIASSTYPLDIYVAKYLAKKYKAKLVYEVHDLWPISVIESGVSAKHPFMVLCQHAENYAYKHSDVVVSMLPKVHEHMASHGLDLRKLHIIPNGIVVDKPDESENLPSSLEKLISELRQKNHVIVGYAGSHGRPNALQYLIGSANLLKDKNISFILVGDGFEKNNLINMARNYDLSNLFFFDYIPKQMVYNFLSMIDIAYIGWNNMPLYRFGISPNKLMDYMFAKKVIVHSVQAGNDPVAESGCGLTVPPEDVDAISNAILELSALSKDERQSIGEKGYNYVLEHHSYSVLARKFIDAIS